MPISLPTPRFDFRMVRPYGNFRPVRSAGKRSGTTGWSPSGSGRTFPNTDGWQAAATSRSWCSSRLHRREPARPSASSPDRVPTMKISAQFATSLSSAEHILAAEQLGYDRAWLFDTPHESPDVWMMLALAADRTATIGLGPGVLVPTLRHPMVNASAA